jgi:hypothetical protein
MRVYSCPRCFLMWKQCKLFHYSLGTKLCKIHLDFIRQSAHDNVWNGGFCFYWEILISFLVFWFYIGGDINLVGLLSFGPRFVLGILNTRKHPKKIPYYKRYKNLWKKIGWRRQISTTDYKILDEEAQIGWNYY